MGQIEGGGLGVGVGLPFGSWSSLVLFCLSKPTPLYIAGPSDRQTDRLIYSFICGHTGVRVRVRVRVRVVRVRVSVRVKSMDRVRVRGIEGQR